LPGKRAVSPERKGGSSARAAPLEKPILLSALCDPDY